MAREFALIAALADHLAPPGGDVVLAAGDDAAVIEMGGAQVAISCDAVVDGVHFDRSISSYSDVGWRALSASVSDLAATGARPSGAVVSLLLPEQVSDDDVLELYDGLRQAADKYGLALLGGDTVSSPVLALAVTVVGRVLPRGPLTRSGARPGDVVGVVGALGAAAAGLALHRAGVTDVLDAHPELDVAHRRPSALIEAGEALVVVGASAAIDVSDGLGADLGHVARASGVSIRLDAGALPVSDGVAAAAARLELDPIDLVLGGGDDLALAVTMSNDGVDALTIRLAEHDLEWRQIGVVVEGEGVVLVGADGATRDVGQFGYEHGPPA